LTQGTGKERTDKEGRSCRGWLTFDPRRITKSLDDDAGLLLLRSPKPSAQKKVEVQKKDEQITLLARLAQKGNDKVMQPA